jgi:hypothetical protein
VTEALPLFGVRAGAIGSPTRSHTSATFSRLAQAAIAAPDGSSNASAVSVRMSSMASVAGER